MTVKYDGFQKGANITTFMFSRERIKNFINTNSIKEYYIVSSLLNFNVKELFHSIIKDFVYDSLVISSKGDFKDQNCLIF